MTPVRKDLAALYEQLRQQVLLGLDAGQGLGLLLHRGMKAWIQAWSLCPVPAPLERSAPPVARQTIPVQVHAELVVLLAGIALTNQRGGTR